MTRQPSLAALQRWMQQVITHPAGVAAGIDAARHDRADHVWPDDITRIISPSQQCSSAERLAVYSNAYLLRLLECLQAEFPALTTILGEESFRQLAVEYLRSHPSTSYTLGELGHRFPRFLATTRPPREDPSGPPDWADLLVDVATLERTYAEVFDGPGDEQAPGLDRAAMAQLGAMELDQVRLLTATSLRLLTLRFPVHQLVTESRHTASLRLPAPATTRLAVYRRDYVVRRVELSQEQWELLSALHRGETVRMAIAAAFAESSLAHEALEAQLQEWFHDWTRGRLLLGVRSGGESLSGLPR